MKARKLTAEEVKRKDLKGLKLTDWDIQNIRYLVEFFRKAFPGVIEEIARQGRAETKAALKQKTHEDQLNFMRRMAMPDGLLRELKKAYPSIIVDRGQFEQFLKAFPEFDLLAR